MIERRWDNDMVTMQELASSLGISRATVSYALSRDWKTKGVSRETRRRVLARAQEMGYRRNPMATALRTKVSYQIGVLTGDISGGNSARVLRGIESVLGNRYSLIVASSDGAAKEKMYLQRFKSQMVDGLIIVHLISPKHAELVLDLQRQGKPVVQTGVGVIDGIETVEVDNVGIGRALTERLVSLGYRRIAYVWGQDRSAFAQHRRRGYEEAALQHGIQPVSFPEESEGVTPSSVATGVRATAELCKKWAPPFAVVLDDSMSAVGVLKTLGDHGLSCPHHVSICACGNREISICLVRDLFELELSRVTWPAEEVGSYAARRLLARLHEPGCGDEGPFAARHGTLEEVGADWVPGNTTAPACHG